MDAKVARKLEYNRAYYAANQEKLTADSRARYRRTREARREQQNEYHKQYYLNNKAKFAGKVSNRRAAKLQRTPSWANLDKIAEMYELAQFATEESGAQYHVDHIIPLQGAKVSGLHVYENLRVIPAKENLRKHNKHDI